MIVIACRFAAFSAGGRGNANMVKQAAEAWVAVREISDR
jgi:hypothetical protein